MLGQTPFSQHFQLTAGIIPALCIENSCLAPKFHQSRLQCEEIKSSAVSVIFLETPWSLIIPNAGPKLDRGRDSTQITDLEASLALANFKAGQEGVMTNKKQSLKSSNLVHFQSLFKRLLSP